MGFWDWLSGTGVDITKVLSSGGLITLLVAFIRGWVLTSAQLQRELAERDRAHAAEIANLNRFHSELRAADAQRYSELAESRDHYRDARLEEKTRADKASDQLAESVELAKASVHALSSLNEAASR